MNSAPIYQVDAFTGQLFGGNPAAVCLLDEWPEDQVMQNIAQENNLSETAFLVKKKDRFKIRWFTPAVEMDLCGHATLAAAHVLFHLRNFAAEEIEFDSKSGPLKVYRNDQKLTLDFPSDPPGPYNPPPELMESLALKNGQTYRGKTDILVVVEDQEQVENLEPDFHLLGTLDVRGVIVSARGKEVDFVSRFFAPASGIDEDPVTGSAHCTLTPYWSQQLEKNTLSALQLSPRRGELICELHNDRVRITGSAVIYLTGLINY